MQQHGSCSVPGDLSACVCAISATLARAQASFVPLIACLLGWEGSAMAVELVAQAGRSLLWLMANGTWSCVSG